MKTKTLIVIFAAMVLIIGLGVRAMRQASQAGAASAALAPQRDELREKAGRMEARLQTAREALLALEQKSTATSGESGSANQRANAAANGKDQSVNPATPGRRVSPMTLVANDPPKMAEYTKNFRAGLDLDYGGMFKAVGLSPEQIEKFKDIEVWLQESRIDLQAAIDAQGLDSTSAEYKKLWSDYSNLRTTKKAEVLGDLAERYFEYYGAQSVRDYVQQLASRGIIAGEAISSSQVERVTDILSANSKRSVGPGAKWVDRDTINWAAASGQLKDVLSPAQIETLGLLIEANKAATRISEQTNRLTAQFKGQPQPK